MILLLAMSNAILHLLAALLIAHNPFLSLQLMQECTIGFSGVLVSLIVIETNLSGVQSRSAFGLFNVPAYMYFWILLLVFQVLMSNVSFLGHLCGILSGFAYTYGLFNFLITGPSFFSAIEASPLDKLCKEIQVHNVHRKQYHRIHTYIHEPKHHTQTNDRQDGRFPGRGRTLGSGRTDNIVNSDYNLQARLLDTVISNALLDSICKREGLQSAVPVSAKSPPSDQVKIVNGLFFSQFVEFISEKFQGWVTSDAQIQRQV